RLRGSPNVVRDISPKNVSTTIDLSNMRPGEKIVPLSPQNVQAPFGAEVIRVNPSSVRFNLERTLAKTVPVVPTILGQPANGFEFGAFRLSPNKVDSEGRPSRKSPPSSLPTIPIRLDRRQPQIAQTADLDVPDPQIRLQRPAPVVIRVEIR